MKRGRGVTKSENFADVIYGSPLGRYVNAILTTPDEKGISTKSGSLVGGAKGKREREQHKGGKVQEVIQGGACRQYML